MISPPVAGAADRHLAAIAALDPAVAKACGTDIGPVALPDYSPEAFQTRRDLAATRAAELAAVPQPERDPLQEAISDRLFADTTLYDSGFTPSLPPPLATPVARPGGVDF